MQRELAQAPGGRQHVALEVVLPSAQLVQHEAVVLAMRQQPRLVGLSARLEDRHGLRQRHLGLVDRHVGGDDGAHARGDGLQLAGAERRAPADPAVVRAQRRRRVLDEDRRVGEDSAGRGHQHQRQRAPVDARPVRVAERHRRHIGIRHQRHRQFAQPPVDHRRHRFVPVDAGLRLGDAEDVADRRRRRGLEDAAVGKTGVDGVPRGAGRIRDMGRS